jgi:succinate dehydrogenase/fumarate reductase flavoprotein subunit
MDRETIEEIHEEENEIIQDLEDLVSEFAQGYADYPYSLRNYLDNVMWPRLATFRCEQVLENAVNHSDELAVHVRLVHNPAAS